MDNTIRIITDSGCDISKENEEKYKGLLEIMPFMVTIQGKSYVDRQDIQAEEFYKVLKEQQEIPKHSQITAIQFEDKYRELYAQGVRTIIVDVINGAGSQTCSNAQLAKQNVADELKDLTVYIVDSQNYTLAYGYPVIEACKKLEAGQSAESVVSYLEDWARHSEAFIVGFDLRHMKKSGRITAAASFLGELMGLKPLIYLAAEKTEVLRKARGEKAVIDAAVETITSRMIPETLVRSHHHPPRLREGIHRQDDKEARLRPGNGRENRRGSFLQCRSRNDRSTYQRSERPAKD